MNLIKWLKSKLQWVVIVVLTTLLVTNSFNLKSKTTELTTLRENYAQELSRNERLTSQIESLKTDLENKPKEYIQVTKEVMTEVCNGKLLVEKINNLERNTNEESNVANTAGLDARLPDELVWLLK